jgi:ATP-dependent DNA ligase
MDLPVMPPVSPMLAKAVKGVPTPTEKTGGLLYEPKWDGMGSYPTSRVFKRA